MPENESPFSVFFAGPDPDEHEDIAPENLLDRAALLVVLDRRGRIIHFNQECERLTGFSAAEVHGSSLNEVICAPGNDVSFLTDELPARGNDQEPRIHRLHWRTKTGGTREVLLRGSRFSSGFEDYEDHLLVGVDLTGHSVQGLQEVESFDQLLHIFSAIPSAVSISSLEDGRFAEVNDAFCDLHGLERNDVIGRTGLELGIWGDPMQREDFIARLRTGETIRNLPVVMRGRQGKRCHCLFSGEIIVMRESRYIFSTLHDITERIEIEDTRRRAELFQTATEVAADFKDALDAIMKNGAALLARPDVPASAAGLVRGIMRSASFAAWRARDFRDLGRNGPAERVSVDLNSLVERCREKIAPSDTGPVRIEITLSPAAPLVTVDPDMLEHALVNIAFSGIEAMQDGGLLSIRVFMPADGEDFAHIRISDTGHGIPRERLEHIFEPYSSAEGDALFSSLGLAVAHSIVKQHGGRLEVQSKENEGAQVDLFLPRLGNGKPAAASRGQETDAEDRVQGSEARRPSDR